MIIAITGAVTVAQRLKRELERLGCSRVDIIHSPEKFNKGGCSYSVRIADDYLLQLLQISTDKHIKIKRIVKQSDDGGGFYDIS